MIGVGTKVRVRILPPMPDALAEELFYSVDAIRNTIYLEYM